MSNGQPCPTPGCDFALDAERVDGDLLRCRRCGTEFRCRVDESGGISWPATRSESSGPDREVPGLPAVFGRYRVLKKIGQGGMGEVYLAHDDGLDRAVALKVPSLGVGDEGTAFERFHREARAAASLRHPNFCPVYEVGQVAGRPFMAMAYIEGEPLSSTVGRDRPRSPGEAVALIFKLARAMAEAHDRGILHRDLKPSNVMIDGRGEPIIMDFGLARRFESGEEPALTASGAMLGTILYMSPEQVMGDRSRIGPATDIYSLGVIFYELLTGRLPFRGTPSQVVGLILSTEPPTPSSLRPEIPPGLQRICLRAMAKRVEDRYPGMRDLAGVLNDYLGQPEPMPAGPATDRNTPRPGRRRSLAMGAVGVVMAAVLMGLVGSLKTPSDTLAEARGPAGGRAETPSLVISPPLVPLPAAGVPPGGEARLATEPGGFPPVAQGITEVGRFGPHLGDVDKAVVSDDGARLLTLGDQDDTARCWELPSGRELWSLGGHPAPIQAICLSGDGKIAALGGKDGSVRLIDATTRRDLNRFSDHNAEVHSLCLSADGKTILSGHADSTAIHREVATGRVIHRFAVGSSFVNCVRLSTDGRRVFAVSYGEVARLWDAQSGREVWNSRGSQGVGSTGGLSSAVMSREGMRIMTNGWIEERGVQKYHVKLWDAETGQEIRLPEGRAVGALSDQGGYALINDPGEVLRLIDARSGDERRRFVAQGYLNVGPGSLSADGRSALLRDPQGLALWDTETGQPIVRMSNSRDCRVDDADMDGNVVFACGGVNTGFFKIWDRATGRELKLQGGHSGAVARVLMSRDGRRVLTRNRSLGTTHLWDRRTGRELWRSEDGWSGLQISNDGLRVLAFNGGGHAQLWDVTNGRSLWSSGDRSGQAEKKDIVTDAVLSGDGRSLFSLRGDGAARYREVEADGDAWHVCGPSKPITAIALANQARIAMMAVEDEGIRLVDVDSGKERSRLGIPGHQVHSLRASDDGRRVLLLCGIADPNQPGVVKRISAELWDTEARRLLWSEGGPSDAIINGVLSADGRRAMLKDRSGSWRIWDAEAGEELWTLGQGDWVQQAILSPDGRRVLVSFVGCAARLLDADNGKEIGRWVGSEAPINDFCLSDDGHHAAFAADDGTARLWSLPERSLKAAPK